MEQYIMKGGNPLRGEVTISGAKNAALLAIAILALQDKALLEQLESFRKQQTEKVVNTVI